MDFGIFRVCHPNNSQYLCNIHASLVAAIKGEVAKGRRTLVTIQVCQPSFSPHIDIDFWATGNHYHYQQFGHNDMKEIFL